MKKWICPFGNATPKIYGPDGKNFNWVLVFTDYDPLPYEICRFDGEKFINYYGDAYQVYYWMPLHATPYGDNLSFGPSWIHLLKWWIQENFYLLRKWARSICGPDDDCPF